MCEATLVVGVCLLLLMYPAVRMVHAEIGQRKRLKQMAKAQRNVAELLGRRAAK